MVRIETRPLRSEEEQQLVEEAGAGPSRGETGCLLALGLGAMPVLGWLIGDNIAVWLGIGHRVTVLSGALVGLTVGLLWASGPFLLAGRAGRRVLREARRLKLAAGPVERWTFEPARAWNVECPETRALLLELSDGRLLLLATRQLEGLAANSYLPRVEMEVLPQLDRVLSLSMAGEPRRTQNARLTLEELGNDRPAKKRRFAEIAPQGLDQATRERLGVSVSAGQDSAPEPRRLPLDRAFRVLDEVERLRPLAPPGARVTDRLLTWIVPASALVAVFVGRSRSVPWPRGGVAASLTLVLVVLWFLGVVLGDAWRRRSVRRVLAHGRGSLVHVSGRVWASRTFPAPLSGRPAVFARVDLLLGPCGLMQAVEFAVQRRDGTTLRVDVSHAALLRKGGAQCVVRVETSRAERMLRETAGVEWYRKRRFQFPIEDVVQDGDVVELLGWLEEPGTIRGTAERPLLAWTGDAARAACSPLG